MASAINSPVRRARRSDDVTMPSSGPSTPSALAAILASLSPRPLNGGSARPCHLRSAFHVDSPWRTMNTDVVLLIVGVEVAERDQRGVHDASGVDADQFVQLGDRA